MVSVWDPEAPPLTPQERCQTLVLEDCSRRPAGEAEASVQGESKSLGRTHSQCKGTCPRPLSRLWALMPPKQRLGPEHRSADHDTGWKTGRHGCVYPSLADRSHYSSSSRERGDPNPAGRRRQCTVGLV